MIVLALDTATLTGSVALLRDGQTVEEFEIPAGQTHSRTLMPGIQGLLNRAGLSVRDLDLIAVGIGPGSFTGLRIGLAAAKGMAWAAKKPMAGIPSPDAMVGALPLDSLPACPLIQARKDQVYYALYDSRGGVWSRRTEYESVTIAELADRITEPTVVFGDAVHCFGPDLKAALGDRFRPGPAGYDHPRAVEIARLGAEILSKGEALDPAEVLPLYIRPPDIRPMKNTGLPGIGRFARRPDGA